MVDPESSLARPATCGRRCRGAGPSGAALAAVAWLVLLGGCASRAPEPPQSMRDPQANFAAYRTFGWHVARAGEDAPLTLVDSQIRAAIAQELVRRGYVAAPDGEVPDLRIAFETATAETLRNSPVRVGVGVGSWGGNVGGSVNVGTPGVRRAREGTLLVQAIDTARNAEVWQGSVSQTLGRDGVEPATIGRAVAAVMREFPAR